MKKISESVIIGAMCGVLMAFVISCIIGLIYIITLFSASPLIQIIILGFVLTSVFSGIIFYTLPNEEDV